MNKMTGGDIFISSSRGDHGNIRHEVAEDNDNESEEDPTRRSVVDLIRDYYSVVNPTKVASAENVARYYEGFEEQIFVDLEQTYGVTKADALSEAAARRRRSAGPQLRRRTIQTPPPGDLPGAISRHSHNFMYQRRQELLSHLREEGSLSPSPRRAAPQPATSPSSSSPSMQYVLTSPSRLTFDRREAVCSSCHKEFLNPAERHRHEPLCPVALASHQEATRITSPPLIRMMPR
eukprot:PhM_4_TR16411/c0_g1_i1/m.48529